MDHVDVGEPPLGVEPVDAHHDFARAEAAGLDRLPHLLARGCLGLGRDRVLEVEDDGVDVSVRALAMARAFVPGM